MCFSNTPFPWLALSCSGYRVSLLSDNSGAGLDRVLVLRVPAAGADFGVATTEYLEAEHYGWSMYSNSS